MIAIAVTKTIAFSLIIDQMGEITIIGFGYNCCWLPLKLASSCSHGNTNGNHGNYEYRPYLDHAKPDHHNLYPTPSELDDDGYPNQGTKGDWETENEGEVEGDEHGELEDRVYEPQEPRCDD